MVTCRWAALGLLFLGACVPAEPATPGPDGGPNDDATAPSEAASFDAVTPESDTTLDGGSPPDVTIGPAEASPNPEAGVADGAIMPEAGIADGSAVPEAGIADGAHDAARPEGGPPPDAGCLASDLSCSGACVPNDVRNCGFCGHDCTALPHVSGPVTCLPTSGACSFLPSSCAPGWTHCAANADLGCETDLSTMS
ncbi:MAG TPA: hypothetical protein VN894_07995, partial [Polyangiaceae bacterium]|nr:hypothetical protein [Polyangiaceae bacterium]